MCGTRVGEKPRSSVAAGAGGGLGLGVEEGDDGDADDGDEGDQQGVLHEAGTALGGAQAGTDVGGHGGAGGEHGAPIRDRLPQVRKLSL